MSKTQNSLAVRTSIRAGGIQINHGLKVRTSVRAGGIQINHGLRVRALRDR